MANQFWLKNLLYIGFALLEEWLATDGQSFLLPTERVLYIGKSWVKNDWPIGQSFLTQDSSMYRTRSFGSKNDWLLMANQFWLKNLPYIWFALLEAKMIGHRLANHHIEILGKGLANSRPITFASNRPNHIYIEILSQKWLATDGQSILTQNPYIHMIRSAGSKNDWP